MANQASRYTKKQKDRVRRLLREGKSLRYIEQKTGIPRSNVSDWKLRWEREEARPSVMVDIGPDELPLLTDEEIEEFVDWMLEDQRQIQERLAAAEATTNEPTAVKVVSKEA